MGPNEQMLLDYHSSAMKKAVGLAPTFYLNFDRTFPEDLIHNSKEGEILFTSDKYDIQRTRNPGPHR